MSTKRAKRASPLLLIPFAAAVLHAEPNGSCLTEAYFYAHRLECRVADPAARQELKAINDADLDELAELERADALAKKYPAEPYLELHAAAVAADAGELFPKETAARKKAAVERMQRVLETQKGMPSFLGFYAVNELYYSAGLFYPQYILGLQETQNGWPISGGYSMGVGASEVAYGKLLEGKLEEAQDFARKSIVGWRQCYREYTQLMESEFYYMESLAILGEWKKAQELHEKRRLEHKHPELAKPRFEDEANRLARIRSILEAKEAP